MKLIYFLSSLSSFLYILFILDSFSQFFQSLTLSNRLSINMLCGSLLTTLLSLFVKSCSITLMFLLIVFSFEILNTLIQVFIFMVLSFEYLMLCYYWFNNCRNDLLYIIGWVNNGMCSETDWTIESWRIWFLFFLN